LRAIIMIIAPRTSVVDRLLWVALLLGASGVVASL